MWTASRGGDAGGRGSSSQLWVSRLNLAAIERGLTTAEEPRP
jgi:hypothetical protein